MCEQSLQCLHLQTFYVPEYFCKAKGFTLNFVASSRTQRSCGCLVYEAFREEFEKAISNECSLTLQYRALLPERPGIQWNSTSMRVLPVWDFHCHFHLINSRSRDVREHTWPEICGIHKERSILEFAEQCIKCYESVIRFSTIFLFTPMKILTLNS